MSRYAAEANQTAGPPPPRRPNSLRRSSSMQSIWPAGARGPHRLAGRARDMLTGREAEAPQTLSSDWIEAMLTPERRLVSLSGSRHADTLADFAGLSPGGDLRRAMAERIAEEGERDTLLHRLLDDMAGANFMASSAWYDWDAEGVAGYYRKLGLSSVLDRPVTGLCLSYVPGSEAMTPDGRTDDDHADHPRAVSPVSDTDPFAWHDFVEIDAPNHWRLRRTDLWIEDGVVHADAWFQDSSAVRGRHDIRTIFHEYGLRARFDPDDMTLTGIDVDARVLPFETCRAAPATVGILVGRSAREFREFVPQALRGTLGCTHLNDMLRALQDVSAMAGIFRKAFASSTG